MSRTWYSEIPRRWPGVLNNPDLRPLRFRIAFEDVPNFRLLVGVVLLGKGVDVIVDSINILCERENTLL